MSYDRAVIFLDVDGVLNTMDPSKPYPDDNFDPELPQDCHLSVLHRIVDMTGADIVLSSGWRCSLENLQEVIDALYRWGMHLRGVTTDHASLQSIRACGINIVPKRTYFLGGEEIVQDRGAEIITWLLKHREYTRVLAIDDETDDIERWIPGRCIKTDLMKGLLLEHVMKADVILSKDPLILPHHC